MTQAQAQSGTRVCLVWALSRRIWRAAATPGGSPSARRLLAGAQARGDETDTFACDRRLRGQPRAHVVREICTRIVMKRLMSPYRICSL